MLINDYVKRNQFTLSVQDVLIIRAIQGVIIVGFLLLYIYMFRSRSNKNKQVTVIPTKVERKKASVSPPKRD